MKRKNSGSTRRKSSASGASRNNSRSEAEEATNSSLRLMMLQEEGEFHLFRQQQTAAGKEQRTAKRERMMQLLSMHPTTTTAGTTNGEEHKCSRRPKRRSSEPDLMRCSVRIISDAPILSWEEYRRKRSQYIRSVFFCSVGNLLNRLSSTDLLSSDPPLHQLSSGDNDPSPVVRQKSPVSRKSSLTVPASDYYQTLNNRLNVRLQQLDSRSTRSNQSSSGRSSSTASNGRQSTQRRSSYQNTHQLIHEDCCECAYRPLSQTVTLVKLPDAGRGGQSQWRACMVSGRDSLSCSLNSP